MTQKKLKSASTKNKIKTLSVTEELIFKVDYNNLSEYIKHVYNKEFDIIDDQEKGNDSFCDVRVTGKLDK
jgi:hypothetical protein